MGFKNGRHKTGGRQKGTTNKKTKQAKELIEKVLSKLDETIIEDIEKLSPKNRINLWLSLLAYTVPKPKPVEHKPTNQDFTINLVDAEKKQEPPIINLTLGKPKELGLE